MMADAPLRRYRKGAASTARVGGERRPPSLVSLLVLTALVTAPASVAATDPTMLSGSLSLPPRPHSHHLRAAHREPGPDRRDGTGAPPRPLPPFLAWEKELGIKGGDGVVLAAQIDTVASTATTTATAISSASSSATATTLAKATTSYSLPAPSSVPSVAPSSLPKPFDTTLGVNMSNSCSSFMTNNLLRNDTFVQCGAFSLLVTASNGFFALEQPPGSTPGDPNAAVTNLTGSGKPYADLTAALDTLCGASTDPSTSNCPAVMGSLATRLADKDACGPDLSQGNAIVQSAVQGLRGWGLGRRAGCLTDKDTGDYCFVEAAAEDPSLLSLYYLLSGLDLAPNTVSTCSSCASQLLSLYASYAVDTSLVISKTYPAALPVILGSRAPSLANSTSSSASSPPSGGGWSCANSTFAPAPGASPLPSDQHALDSGSSNGGLMTKAASAGRSVAVIGGGRGVVSIVAALAGAVVATSVALGGGW